MGLIGFGGLTRCLEEALLRLAPALVERGYKVLRYKCLLLQLQPAKSGTTDCKNFIFFM